MEWFDWFLLVFSTLYIVLYFTIPFYGFEDLYPNIALGILLVGFPGLTIYWFVNKNKGK